MVNSTLKLGVFFMVIYSARYFTVRFGELMFAVPVQGCVLYYVVSFVGMQCDVFYS